MARPGSREMFLRGPATAGSSWPRSAHCSIVGGGEQAGTGVILFINVDDAEEVTDGFIEQVAAVVRSTDLVSRMGDHLVAVLCAELPEAVNAVSLSERVHTRLRTHGATSPSKLSISITIAEHGYSRAGSHRRGGASRPRDAASLRQLRGREP